MRAKKSVEILRSTTYIYQKAVTGFTANWISEHSHAMNNSRVDEILQFALAVAGAEEPGRQMLGAIHLLKYVYLADLAHAAANKGETYTGALWRFYQFGPWAPEVHSRIEPALEEIQAAQRVFESLKHEKGAIRWQVEREELDPILERLDKSLPLRISSAIRHAVHEFAADTESLLHHVYQTYPMLRAAPEEELDFTPLPSEEDSEDTQRYEQKNLTVRQKRKLKELKEHVQSLLKSSSTGVLVTPDPAPRYDGVFEDGQKQLDALAGEPITEDEGVLTFSDGVWKSPGRSDPGVS